jgi:hypothetical protein
MKPLEVDTLEERELQVIVVMEVGPNNGTWTTLN